MRLGLTNSTYQYLFGGWLFPNRTSPEFSLFGQPTPYFTQTPAHIDPSKALEWLIQKCVQLELPVIHGGINNWDPAYVDTIKGLLKTHKLEMMPSIAGDFVNVGDVAKKAVDAACETLQRYQKFGDIRISKYCTYPMIHTR